MTSLDNGGREKILVINPTNVPRTNELVVAWLRTERAHIVSAKSLVALYDQVMRPDDFIRLDTPK